MPKPQTTEIELKNSGDQVWIRVGPFNVNVQRTDEGVIHDVWRIDRDGVIDGGYTFWNDGQEEED